MISLATFTTPPGPCSLLPGRVASMQYEIVAAADPAEYEARILEGWRHFGHAWFRPRCPACAACRALRIDPHRFTPDRSQRRNRNRNGGVVTLSVGRPDVDAERLDLFDRFHAYQGATKGWGVDGPKEADDYAESFVRSPTPVEEWQYRLAGKLVGVGLVDPLPESLSAIYFYHDPGERPRGLGTWNVLSVIERAARLGKRWVHLGFHVEGCRSLEYKANFLPHEKLAADGAWHGVAGESG